jgi:hypothetical protein
LVTAALFPSLLRMNCQTLQLDLLQPLFESASNAAQKGQSQYFTLCKAFHNVKYGKVEVMKRSGCNGCGMRIFGLSLARRGGRRKAGEICAKTAHFGFRPDEALLQQCLS